MGRSPRPPASNRQVVKTYDRFATWYDRCIGLFQETLRRRAIDSLDPDAGERILEIGCGPGRAVGPVSQAVAPGGSVLGLDAAPGMIDRARARIGRADTPSLISLVLGDARSLPIGTDSIDVVYIEETLELFGPADLASVLDECRRVLKPTGRMGVVTMERAEAERDPFVRVYEWLFEQVPGYDSIGCRPIYASQAIDAAGFAIERRERYRRGYVWPEDLIIARPE